MGHKEHEALAQGSLNAGVITFTDTRDQTTDKSGKIIVELLESAGHQICFYEICQEDPDAMREKLAKLLACNELQVIICNGGTGLSSRDNTIEVIRPMFDKELEGFGEIFRFVSYQQIGAAAMLSRATAGLIGKRAIFCLPGSSKAVQLAMRRIILPQLAHLVWEANR